MPTYTDKNGYERHSNLVHRNKAYEQIYKKNRHKYPLPFSEYVIHHKDGNKKNNNIDNLEILTPEEHNRVHQILKPIILSEGKFYWLKKTLIGFLIAICIIWGVMLLIMWGIIKIVESFGG